MITGRLEISEYGKYDNCVGYVQPSGKNPKWIMWHFKDGTVHLYTKREKNGATTGDPIILK
jgi:hypothetical protein